MISRTTSYLTTVLQINKFLLLLLGGVVGACSVNQETQQYDAFGGYTGIQRGATGWFRVEQVNDRWMFITPQGHGYVALGANHTGRYLNEREQSAGLYERVDDNREQAEEAMYQAYVESGLNAGEAYAPLNPYLENRLPHIAHFNYPNSKHTFDIFDDSVQTSFRQHLLPQCQSVASDSLLLGIAFVDLPIWDSRRVDFYRSLPPLAPGKQAYQRFLMNQHATIQELNESYGTSLASFDELLETTDWALDTEQASIQQDDDLFMGQIAEKLYPLLRDIVREGAPNHLFLGERYVLRMVPEPVLQTVGKYVDVFCTQALILSPQRPPEWQVFQQGGYDSTFAIVQKPIIVVDWATPFSLDETYTTDRGTVREEAQAAEDVAQWVEDALAQPYIIGIFKCQFIGTHGNDRWFPKGRMKRTLWQDDGTPFPVMTNRVSQAHREALNDVYQSVAAEK
ncbi:hypothetical protein [Tunicatimonas pelagia]|uniref:hypothetical protein n=1 Tax=Tunicatimonas pelagia TaxID=931531 RepID=UPI0026664A73|nr:hypothetical protein [Tunicatimonas pelagia]WKN45108.1 hypothetical protein P0M28_09045 [Tunicatimonas pelagia]